MVKRYYSYEEFLSDFKMLAKKLQKPQAIVAVARGGMLLGLMLGEYFDIRAVYTINAQGYDDTKKRARVSIGALPDLSGYNSILVVDDIVDSGETMQRIKEALTDAYPDKHIQTAALFYKKGARFKPDHFARHADHWIDFFWSKDIA
jgi:xanthine phosphoribosyltransferase